MKSSLLLINLVALTATFQIQEVKNPILTVYIGQTKVITTKHTFLFHVNLTYPENSLELIKNSLKTLNTVTDNSNNTLNYFSILLNNKINNAKHLTENTNKKINILFEHTRIKRGLINGVGKIQKWLFGTLDSDDEEHINNYFNMIELNENNLNKDLKTQQSFLKQMTKTYTDSFEKLNKNQGILENQIHGLIKEIKEISNLEQAFSITNTIDNLIMQLHSVDNIINNLETSLSFARLNILHSSIISPFQIKQMLNELERIYGIEQVPKLDKIINYYSLFSTQVIIQNKTIIFKIHTPIVSSIYKYFQVYPVPLLNQTVLPENPYLLLNTENYWTSAEKCPEVENWYFCLQSKLHKQQQCLANLIRTGKNQCPPTSIHFTETSAIQINSKDILVIPAAPFNIKSQCEKEGIKEIKIPSIVTLENCQISIGNKIFQIEQTSHEEFVLELPQIYLPQHEENRPERTFHIKQIDEENIQRINSLATDLQVSQLHTVQSISHAWTNTIIIIVSLMIIICAFWYIKVYKPRQKKKLTPKQEPQKIKEPLFSDLGREELCI
ncbi:uncharacterized protein [Diabrotica undecimpunctata]|uniref:uncharacterized protein n=1 Tax=Diabrotica undecimpunctata TaxID=50387 RepID=UPI003B634ECF